MFDEGLAVRVKEGTKGGFCLNPESWCCHQIRLRRTVGGAGFEGLMMSPVV